MIEKVRRLVEKWNRGPTRLGEVSLCVLRRNDKAGVVEDERTELQEQLDGGCGRGPGPRL